MTFTPFFSLPLNERLNGIVTLGELCETRSLCAETVLKYLLFSKVLDLDLASPTGMIASCVSLRLTGFHAGRCIMI